MKTVANLGHPCREAAIPFVVSVAVQIGVEQDEVDVPLEQIETSLLQRLLVFRCLRLLHLNAAGGHFEGKRVGTPFPLLKCLS